jgi:hypothetical protein
MNQTQSSSSAGSGNTGTAVHRASLPMKQLCVKTSTRAFFRDPGDLFCTSCTKVRIRETVAYSFFGVTSGFDHDKNQ